MDILTSRRVLAVTGVLAALYLLLHGLPQSAVYYVAGFGSAAMIVAGARRMRRTESAAWYAFAVGIALFALGDFAMDQWHVVSRAPLPTPSFVDALYVASYACLAFGVLKVVAGGDRRERLATGIDALIVAVGVGALVWVFVLEPYAHRVDVPLGVRLTALAYPMLDLLLIAALVRLLLAPGHRSRAVWLVTAALVALLVADAFYTAALVHDSYRSGGLTDAGWLLMNGLWAAAAAERPGRVRRVPSEPVPVAGQRVRLVVLGLAALMAPAAIVVEERTVGTDNLVLPVVGAVMVVLVLVRLGQTMAESARAYEWVRRAAYRQRLLAEGTVALVAATDAAEVYEAVERAAAAIVDGPAYVGPPASAPVCDGATDPYVARIAHPDGPGAVLLVGDAVSADAVSALDALTGGAQLALTGLSLVRERQRQRSTRLFGALVGRSADAIVVVGRDLSVRYQSAATQQVFGRPAAELERLDIARAMDELVHPDDAHSVEAAVEQVLGGGVGAHERVECRILDGAGSWRHVEGVLTNLLDDDDVRGIVLNCRDVTRRRALEAQLVDQALHDALTGLPNRTLFLDRVAHSLERRKGPSPGLAVIFVDLDDFKMVNDSLGHAVGDALLCEFADRLRAAVRVEDTVCRLGGDEFAVLVDDAPDRDTAQRVAGRVVATLVPPFELGPELLTVRASIGIAFADAATPDAGALLRDADIAMYLAKRQQGGGCVEFDPWMHEAAVARLRLLAELRTALDESQLVVHYQPITDMHTNDVLGVEALVRWQHPVRGLVPPAEFIPLAEETGLVIDLGRLVLQRACADAEEWRRQGIVGPDFYVSVNIATKHLAHESLLDDVARALATSGLPGTALVVEVTETGLMTDLDAMVAVIGRLHERGVRVAIDDFGTGYSSLGYLSRFAVDILKIDKSFVDRLSSGAEGAALVRSIIDMSGALGLVTIAEGVEEREQVETLEHLGCSTGQGYYFARPMPVDAVTALLAHLPLPSVAAVG